MAGKSSSRVIIRNGSVLSCDEQMNEHEALVLEDGEVLALGNESDMQSLAGSGARSVDVEGATVLPGIVDTHPHMMHVGIFRMNTVALYDARNHDEIVERIRAKAAQTKPGEWIIASPVGEPTYFVRRNYHDLEEGCMPDRHVLDRATDKHPVCIWAMAPKTPNVVSFNSMGLNRVRIHSLTPERVCNVHILKDSHGMPTGVVHGSVVDYFNPDPYWQQILSHLPDVRGTNEYEGGLAGMKFYNTLGVTSAYECHGMTPPQIEAYRKLRANDALSLRIVAALELSMRGRDPHEEPTPELFRERLEQGLELARSDDANDYLRVGGVTLCRSGPCGTGVLRWEEPYKLPFGGTTLGHEWVPKWAEEQTIRYCLENDLRLNLVLAVPEDHKDFFDSIKPYVDKHDLRALDWVIQHALVVTPDQMRQFAELGFKFTTCVGFEWGKGDVWRERIGEHVLKNMIPLNRYLKEGVTVGCGTDWGPKNVFEQMQLAITHELAASGYRNQTPDHVITREQSLLMWTREAACSLSWKKVGSLVPGHFADVTIVDRNPVTCPLEDLPDTRVMGTLLGGKTVHDSGDLKL